MRACWRFVNWMGRAGRAPCQNRDAGLDTAVISGKLKLRPFGWAVYLGNSGKELFSLARW
jgi:hypothetical protein